jgi:vacuolar-type H+-ATPase subunit E/Vma4
MKALLDAMDKEMRKGEQGIEDEAKKFTKGKIDSTKKSAALDNAQLMSIEEKNIDREMRRQEEEIREAHLLGLVRAKEDLVGEAWEEAKKTFLSMPERRTEYRKFMGSILDKSKIHKGYDIFLRKEDLSLCKGAKTEKISGGAVFRSPDGRIEVDYSLEGILRSSEGAARAKISEALFG